MQNVEHRDAVRRHTVEDQVVAVSAVADACVGVARQDRKAFGKVAQSDARCAQLANEGQGARRIVPCDIVADPFEIGFGLVR